MKSCNQNLDPSIFYKRINSFKLGYRQNIAIIANDESEISNFFDDYFSNKKASQLIHIRLNPAHLNKQGILKSISFSLLSEYSSAAENLDQLISTCSEILPQTTNLIKSLLREESGLTRLLNLINKFIEESNRDCLLILENFLKAGSLLKNFYPQLANFAISQRRCMLVVSSASPNLAEKTLGNELNLLFGNFEKIYLNKDNFLQNFVFLKNNLEPLRPSPFFLAFFTEIIGTNKTYYHIFCEKIIKSYSENENQAIIKILEDLLLKKESYFFQKFRNEVNRLGCCFKEPCQAINLLFLLSKGYLRKNDLKEVAGLSSRDLNHKLTKLTNLNCLNKHGNIYKIKDNLFAFWLAHIFKFFSIFPVFDNQKQKQLWEKDLFEEITLFKDEFFKHRLKRILELFSAFQNDHLSINKNRYTLPRLEKVKLMSYPDECFHLLVGEGKKIIFAGIKENTADEKDLLSFLEKGTNIKGKNIQKIFIALDQITDTATLVAKNKKIPVWDQNKLNCLLNVYNKPKIFSSQACGLSL